MHETQCIQRKKEEGRCCRLHALIGLSWPTPQACNNTCCATIGAPLVELRAVQGEADGEGGELVVTLRDPVPGGQHVHGGDRVATAAIPLRRATATSTKQANASDRLCGIRRAGNPQRKILVACQNKLTRWPSHYGNGLNRSAAASMLVVGPRRSSPRKTC